MLIIYHFSITMNFRAQFLWAYSSLDMSHITTVY